VKVSDDAPFGDSSTISWNLVPIDLDVPALPRLNSPTIIPTIILDTDGDGINDDVDPFPDIPSIEFSDGTTTGQIIDSGDHEFTILDVPEPIGLNINNTCDTECTIPVIIEGCNGGTIIELTSGDSVILTCGSVIIQVISGTVDVEFVADDGTIVTTTLSIGDDVTFEPETVTIVNDGLNPVTVIIDGEEIIVEGDSSVDITPKPKKSGGSNQWPTRPTFGISHETLQGLVVENGFRFNTEQFTLTDNHHTDFAEQSIEIGSVNSFSATVYADKKLKVQEFLFGIPNVGEAHLAELRVEVWYDLNGEIQDVIVVQKSDVIDADTVSVSHEKVKCLSTDEVARCDTTTVSMKFLEPLIDKVMAITATDHQRREQRTFLNEGFDISGESLNPMFAKMIPSTVRYEGLLKVTQLAKYSPYWTSEDERMFEMNSFGSFKQINQSFERFQDTGTAYTRLHSGFGGIIVYEQNRALDIFDATSLVSELPDSFAYIYPETGKRITDVMIQEMLVQEEIAKRILNEMDKQTRNH